MNIGSVSIMVLDWRLETHGEKITIPATVLMYAPPCVCYEM